MELYIVDPASRLVTPLTVSGEKMEVAKLMSDLCDGLPMIDFSHFPDSDPTDVIMSIPLALIILEQLDNPRKTKQRGAWGYLDANGEMVPVVGKSIIIGRDMENKTFTTPKLSLQSVRSRVEWGLMIDKDSEQARAIFDEDGQVRDDWKERLHGDEVQPDARAVVTAELEMRRIIH